MEKKQELYMATLYNNNKIIVAIKPENYDDMPIGDKRRQIIFDLNEKFGHINFVKHVRFVGYAESELNL